MVKHAKDLPYDVELTEFPEDMWGATLYNMPYGPAGFVGVDRVVCSKTGAKVLYYKRVPGNLNLHICFEDDSEILLVNISGDWVVAS